MSERGLSRKDVAALTGALLAADASSERRVERVGALQLADETTLVFAEDAVALRAALDSRAGTVLAGLVAEGAEERVMRVREPRLAFALVARALATQQERHDSDSPVIDKAAAVHPTARLGRRARVEAGAVVAAGAVLGDDVRVGCRAVILEGVVLGDRVMVQAGAVLGSLGFGYVRSQATGEYVLFPQQGTLVVEDDVEIGANTTIDRGALEETRIGRGTKIDNLVHIGHNCRIGRNVVIAAQVGISGSCVIGDGAVLAGQVGISDHCEIGPGVILGGQAGVYRGKSVVGAGQVFAGTPAEPLKEQMRGLAQLRRLARPTRKER